MNARTNVPPGAPTEEGTIDPLTLGALQKQIADTRELVDQLRAKIDDMAGDTERLARVESAITVTSAIVRQLHDGTTRTDVSALVSQLKAIVEPIIAERDKTPEARHAA